MAIATHDHVTPGTGMPAPHDPERDIDARAATLWVLGGTVALFLALWLMVPIFLRVQDEERARKVAGIAPEEREQVIAGERAFLGGQNPAKKTIDQVMAEMAAGK